MYQPEIPQNTGAMIRLAACFGVAVEIIEPCGFLLDDRRMRRAGMDYVAQAEIRRHLSWPHFLAARPPGRLVLLTTRGSVPHHRFAFAAGDTLLVGREGAGVPDAVHAACDAAVRVPMRPGLRSLNVALSASVVLAEALRQLDLLPEEEIPPEEQSGLPPSL